MEEEEGREKRGFREKTCQVTLRRGSGNLSCCISKWMIMTPQGGGEKGRFDEINRSDVANVFACVRSPTQPKVDARVLWGSSTRIKRCVHACASEDTLAKLSNAFAHTIHASSVYTT